MTVAARPQAVAAIPRSQLSVINQVAVLRLECPSPGVWDTGHRTALIRELDRLAGDPRFTAIVLHGRRLFEAGNPASGAAAPFPEIVAAVANCPKPVVAAIAGHAAGGGLELALACAGRVASPAATFALPDVAAGRLPLNGAFERLPRLIGVEAAASLIVFGQVIEAAAATELGLVDALAAQNLAAFAANLAGSRLLADRFLPRRIVEPEVAEAQLYAVRLKLRQQLADQAAPLAALRGLEAAVRQPAHRLPAEIARIAQDLAATPQAAALAYVERGAARLRKRDDLDELAARLEWPMLREAVHLLDEGASPAQIDRCLVGYGFREGPFARADRLGLAAVFTPGRGATGADWLSYSATLDLMADAGRHGGPGAAGWYRRAPGTGCMGFDPDVDRLLQASATFQRLHRATIADDVVLTRCLYAAINGAAAALGATPPLDQSQVDAIWATRVGFPRWKGGPLLQAQQIGVTKVCDALVQWRARRDTAGAPSAALARLAGTRTAREIP